MLIDTDVLIWYMRGNARAARRLSRLPTRAVSVVSYIELVQGLRNKRELQALRQTFRHWDVSLLSIDETISYKALFYVEQYFHSHALRLADALIGATAVSHGLALLTANAKHYRVIADLEIQEFKP